MQVVTIQEGKGYSFLSDFYEYICEDCLKVDYSVVQSVDCTKIEVAKNIQEDLFKFLEDQGESKENIGMIWLIYGPKVNEELKDNEVKLEERFVCYEHEND